MYVHFTYIFFIRKITFYFCINYCVIYAWSYHDCYLLWYPTLFLLWVFSSSRVLKLSVTERRQTSGGVWMLGAGFCFSVFATHNQSHAALIKTFPGVSALSATNNSSNKSGWVMKSRPFLTTTCIRAGTQAEVLVFWRERSVSVL